MKPKCSNFDDVFEPRDVSKNVTPWLSGRLGGAAPLEIRPPSLVRLSLAVAERVGEYLDVLETPEAQRLP